MADPNSVPFSVSASGDTTIIAAPVDSRGIAFIDVLGYEITSTGTTTITWNSGAGRFPRRLLDTQQLTAGGGAVADLGGSPAPGIFACDPGGPLVLNQSANGVTVSGRVRYTIRGAG